MTSDHQHHHLLAARAGAATQAFVDRDAPGEEAVTAVSRSVELLARDSHRCAAAMQPTPGVAWRHGLIHYLRGDVVAADEIYAAALEHDSPGGGDSRQCADVAMLSGYASAAAWLVGDVERARTLAQQAMATATAAGTDAAYAVAHTAAAMVAASDGDRVGNEWHYARALQHAEQAGDALQIARIRLNRGSRLMEEGAYSTALSELDQAVRAGEVGSCATLVALALSNRGEVLTRLGRLDEARVDLVAASERLRQDRSRMAAYPLCGLARMFLVRGDVEQALGACERAMSLSEGSKDRQLDVALRVQYAWALAERDVEAGWAVISTAADSAAGSLDEAEVWTVVADLADRRGDTRSAANAAEAAVRLARSRHDQFALARAIEVSAVVSAGEQADVCSERFEEARAIFAELGCVVDVARVDVRLAGYDEADRGRARAMGAAEAARKFGARPIVRAAERVIRDLDSNASPPLSVIVIGSLSITRNGEPVARAAWQSKKARDLFKMLLARRGRPVPRDQAVERLWPGEEPGAVMNRLSVALATARAVLDPDKRFEADHFIAADGDAIKLVTDSIDIDVERFLALARTALHENRHGDSTVAATMLAASEAMCGGDVFEEDPYDDWYMPLREEMRATYISIAMSLADLRVGEGDFDDAIRLLLRVLEREPYDESAHRKLIELLVRGGRHGDARRRYEYYAARMRELDLQPVAFPR